MSHLAPNQLTNRKVTTAENGLHCDGGNLWLSVVGKSRTWSVRYTSPITGKRREMGLGPLRDVPLATAREQATSARQLLRRGIDPIEHRKSEEAGRRRSEATIFRTVAARYIEEQTPGWSDPERAKVWTSSLKRLAYPFIGDKHVDGITTEDVLEVLRPVWATKNDTADRVRGRIERILDYARIQGWREGDNPARWRGHLAMTLPKPSDVSAVEHQGAVPWGEIARVMAKLASSTGTGALAVRFVCLTAVRSAEARGTTWGEIDLTEKVWTIPSERMKGTRRRRREHRVPLSLAALEILAGIGGPRGPTDLVFPGGRPGQPLSDVALSKALHLAAGTKAVTVHGLRSTFRDWTAEATDYPRDAAEMALAHSIGDKVEAAYRRGDLFKKRREMMEDWAAYCEAEKTATNAPSEIACAAAVAVPRPQLRTR
jgi:integrase